MIPHDIKPSAKQRQRKKSYQRNGKGESKRMEKEEDEKNTIINERASERL